MRSFLESKLALVRKQWIWMTLLIMEAAIVFVRFHVLNTYEGPPGSDAGNHLSVLNAIRGYDVTGFDLQFRYPPLYFLFVLDPLTRVLPIFAATKISATLVSSIIAIPFFFLAKKITQSNTIALFSAGLFALAEGYSEMMCWGGIPNFLGIFFMLWSMYFVIDLEKISKRNAILGGFFLSLTAGAHHLTFAYYIITLALSVLLIFVINRNLAKHVIEGLGMIGMTGVLFSLPYLPFYMTFASKNSMFATFDTFAAFPAIDISSITFFLGFVFRHGSIYIWITIAVMGFFGLWKYNAYVRNGKFLAAILSSLLLAIVILSMCISDARPVYFLYVPILLAFSVSIKYLFKWPDARHSILPSRARTLCLVALLTILASSLLEGSYVRLVESEDFYQVLTKDIIEALDWMRENTELGSFAITNDMRLAWWIEGYALRRCYMPAAKSAFIYTDQQSRAEIANMIITGNHVIDNGHLKVADFFPAGDYNPRISVNLGDREQDILFLNDTYTSLIFSPDCDSNETIVAGLHSKAENMQLGISSEEAVIKYTYTLDGAVITRTIIVNYAPQVIVAYNVTANGSFVKGFEVPMSVPSDINVRSYDATGGSAVRLALADIYNSVTYVNLTVLETDGEIDVDFLPNDPNCLVPTFFFTCNKTSGSNLFVKFLVAVSSKVYFEQSNMQYFDAYDLIRTHNITYIFLNKKSETFQAYQLHYHGLEDVRRFASDPEHFGAVFQNDQVIIFKVLDV